MMAAGGDLIEAAGGVLWRPAQGRSGVEIALVHRPKYDDWSLPKGKLHRGEHPLLGALREITEETGFAGRPGRMLGEIGYLKDGSPKRVRYWAVRAVAGGFVCSNEVDQLIWRSPQEALAQLAPDRDRPIVLSFEPNTRSTVACIVLRHGDVEQREAQRAGQHQADVLAQVLAAFDVRRVLSANVGGCLDTIGRFASNHGIMIETEPLLSNSGYASAPQAAEAQFLAVLTTGEPVVVCGQGKSISPLLRSVGETLNGPLWKSSTPQNAFVALHFDAENPSELVAIDDFPPFP
jgi:8-oxo-(d)GTP phosphatase